MLPAPEYTRSDSIPWWIGSLWIWKTIYFTSIGITDPRVSLFASASACCSYVYYFMLFCSGVISRETVGIDDFPNADRKEILKRNLSPFAERSANNLVTTMALDQIIICYAPRPQRTKKNAEFVMFVGCLLTKRLSTNLISKQGRSAGCVRQKLKGRRKAS